jgi:DNA polymerase-3 subunit delta
MKLNFAQLDTHLKKNLAPIYIVGGDELLLKQEALNAIRKTAKKAEFSERTRLMPDGGFDWDDLHNELYGTSLLATKRIIELDLRNATPNKAASSVLQSYAANPVSEHLLLIDISKIDDKISKSAWYKALEKIGVVVNIWPVPRDQLPQWIINRIKKYKLAINLDAANLLAEHIEGNLSAAAQAIEKLYLLQPTQTIDTELVKALLTDESRFTIFDFLENLIAGNKTRSLSILENLKNEGIEPVLIIWGITRELRLLANLAQQKAAGTPVDALLQSHRIFFGRQTAFRRFLNRASATDCWQLLTQAAGIDRIIKGAAPGHVWDSLQLFCLRLV